MKLAPWSLQGLGHVRERRRALEDHVFEQVGHAGLAVALVPGADEDGQVDGDVRLRGVGEEQDAQAVVELVFGDAFDGGDLDGVGGRGGVEHQQCSERGRGHGPTDGAGDFIAGRLLRADGDVAAGSGGEVAAGRERDGLRRPAGGGEPQPAVGPIGRHVGVVQVRALEQEPGQRRDHPRSTARCSGRAPYRASNPTAAIRSTSPSVHASRTPAAQPLPPATAASSRRAIRPDRRRAERVERHHRVEPVEELGAEEGHRRVPVARPGRAPRRTRGRRPARPRGSRSSRRPQLRKSVTRP